ncbi:hypothetical protein BST81_22815 [Leptolyngbya sp. 'hensonii']|uniref:DUF1830 domain-containing protein n=1 Tax=Leptolyngbya sp. 'hensonii' TaxID=1922337 RepID=UPI00094FC21A|nr:DUF1830 domain-containing protein [Leptolyngbya sp. 'hensonii']OLP16063.1 hypothetical protein BST81_22815 [Leptolyngbya sp. 'hensonii']
MPQLLDPVPSDNSDRIVCSYVNATSKIQVVRISNIPNWYFERVVFPGQQLLFETLPEAQLEIHTGMMASAILSDRIPCDRLMVEDAGYPSIDPANQQSIEEENEGPNLSVTAPPPALTSTIE